MNSGAADSPPPHANRGGGGMQPQPTAERMHPYVWPGAPPAHNWGGERSDVTATWYRHGSRTHTHHTQTHQYRSYSWDSGYTGVKMAGQCVVICSEYVKSILSYMETSVQWVRWCERVKMTEQCVVICSWLYMEKYCKLSSPGLLLRSPAPAHSLGCDIPPVTRDSPDCIPIVGAAKS